MRGIGLPQVPADETGRWRRSVGAREPDKCRQDVRGVREIGIESCRRRRPRIEEEEDCPVAVLGEVGLGTRNEEAVVREVHEHRVVGEGDAGRTRTGVDDISAEQLLDRLHRVVGLPHESVDALELPLSPPGEGRIDHEAPRTRAAVEAEEEVATVGRIGRIRRQRKMGPVLDHVARADRLMGEVRRVPHEERPRQVVRTVAAWDEQVLQEGIDVTRVLGVVDLLTAAGRVGLGVGRIGLARERVDRVPGVDATPRAPGPAEAAGGGERRVERAAVSLSGMIAAIARRAQKLGDRRDGGRIAGAGRTGRPGPAAPGQRRQPSGENRVERRSADGRRIVRDGEELAARRQ